MNVAHQRFRVRAVREQDCGLAAGSRAAIQNACALPEQLRNQLRAFILKLDRGRAGNLRRAGIACLRQECAGLENDSRVLDLGLRIQAQQPQRGARLLLGLFANAVRPVAPVDRAPALDHPFGNGIFRVEAWLLRQGRYLAQHRIYQPRLPHRGGVLHPLHSLEDGCVRGNAVEKKQLKRSHAESQKRVGVQRQAWLR